MPPGKFKRKLSAILSMDFVKGYHRVMEDNGEWIFTMRVGMSRLK